MSNKRLGDMQERGKRLKYRPNNRQSMKKCFFSFEKVTESERWRQWSLDIKRFLFIKINGLNCYLNRIHLKQIVLNSEIV